MLFQKVGPTLTALLGQDASLEVATRLYRIMVLDRRLSSTPSTGSVPPVRRVEKP